MAGQLKQINISFQPVEDRLLLLISMTEGNTVSEFRFWMTRRFVRILWQQIEQALEGDAQAHLLVTPDGREAFKQFQQEAAIAKTDFSTPYKGEATQIPLGPTPLLLYGCRTSKESAGQYSILLMTTDKQSLSLSLNVALVHSLRKLLFEQAQRAEWDLALSMHVSGVPYMVDAPKTIN